ncbi:MULTISPECIES: sirohydrochlorin chelatase [Mycobacterium]|uniref:sirohydrochlorin chelatase n=1 Tax=Mycobacterium TaxID=1763 RepID=UPI001EEF9744|nr:MULTISPECIES: sirohydrochlorin chelatase [Mycobacterium]BDB40090.1 cobalamin biosynthesis protein CbiX [Mycobacterium kiyosense]BDE11926.1 cobalamin biosynthesis protein CbiX [Mycobacterium sp. 20KCMC460]GLB92056.1 cobalamin biosynthesis protein CbiX [Mycobacterium kiyosense]GLC04321.1 cobalamin biosynthesis protein CbiX [Mycobacterium kiyosense]GLC08858.1 cobalamin biosynthesis protein CbiX [Mycobacterium kiyosense]
MNLILTAHGTRRPSGVAMVGDLAARVSRLLPRTVQVAFVDVLGPTPSEVLSQLPDDGQPAIVVPAFLSRGYHVRTDLPAHVAASGHPDVRVAPALGPGCRITAVLGQVLLESGWRPGDSVILGAAGTSDHRARSDLHNAAAALSAFTGSRVDIGFAAVGTPHIRDAVDAARRRGAARVVIASYLLADGLFAHRLRSCGADLVTPPLGTHAGLARLVAHRFRAAAAPTEPRRQRMDA